MYTTMRFALIATVLALIVWAAPGAIANQQPNPDSNATPGATTNPPAAQDTTGTSIERPATRSVGSSMNQPYVMDHGMGRTDWSSRYQLTPVEHKRLRSLGLTDDEVFAVASAAHAAGIQLDGVNLIDPVQMVLIGYSYWDIARALNVPVSVMENRLPEWQTAEWKQATDEGWPSFPSGAAARSNTTEPRH